MSKENKSFEFFADRVIRARKRIKWIAQHSAHKYESTLAKALDDFPSNVAVRDLIQYCFNASLELDEGRLCRFAAKWTHKGLGRGYIAKFSKPMPITSPTQLSKLAHATADDSAISLQFSESGFEIDGVASRFSKHLEDSEAFAGILIVVRGPGVIEYSETGYSVSFTRGTILAARPFWNVAQIKEYLRGLEERQCEKSIASLNRVLTLGDNKPLDENVKQSIMKNTLMTGRSQLRTMLHSVQRMGHGGMIALCDDPPVGIERRYPECTSDLEWMQNNRSSSQYVLGSFGGYVALSCRDVASTQNYEIDNFLHATGALTGLDGCIILDKDLRILELGAIIKNVDGKSDGVALVDERRNPVDFSFYSKRGTRHRAAVNFCTNNLGAIVLLVSQDGDIRLFIREATRIVFVENLTAW